jgi:hypothetical protein
MDIKKVLEIMRGSKQYEFHGAVLTVTGYYTGERVKLDLSNLTEEMLDELAPDDDSGEEC